MFSVPRHNEVWVKRQAYKMSCTSLSIFVIPVCDDIARERERENSSRVPLILDGFEVFFS